MRLPAPAAPLAALALLTLAVRLPAQTPAPAPPAPALVAGHVVDGITGRPVTAATVMIRLIPPNNAPPAPGVRPPGLSMVLVDDEGRFAFDSLTAGSYQLTAAKRGYAGGGFGVLRPDGNGQSLALAAGQHVSDVTLRLWKYGTIAGSLIDEYGDPLVGVKVVALERGWDAGHERFMSGGSAGTDDRGAYRFNSLEPGDYVVSVPVTQDAVPTDRLPQETRIGTRDSVQVGDVVLVTSLMSVIPAGPGAHGRWMVYPTTYDPPLTGDANQRVVTVTAGQNVSVPPLQLRAVPSVRVAGTLAGLPPPPARASLRLIPRLPSLEALDNEAQTATTSSDSTGHFTFVGVTPGQYELRGTVFTPPDVNQPGAYAVATGIPMYLSQPVTVGAEDLTLDVALRPAYRLTARVVFDGQRPPPSDSDAKRPPYLEPADSRGSPSSGTMTAGEIAFDHLAPGRYTLIPATPPGWFLRSMTQRDADVLDAPIDVNENVTDLVVTFTDRTTSLQGSVRTLAGAADPDTLVILFPTDPARRVVFGSRPHRLLGARPNANGVYSFTTVVPGDYLIAAVPDVSASAWRSPPFLEKAARLAVRVRVSEGATATQDLTRVDIK